MIGANTSRKSKTHSAVGVVAFAVLALAGLSCSTAPRMAMKDMSIGNKPGPSFSDYRQLFSWIAKCEGLPTDARTIFDLAAESKLDYFQDEKFGKICIIEVNYYGDGQFNQIRGAQGNGRYYVIKSTERGFDLVGILEGNSYSWDNVGERRRLITTWHMSISENEGMTYDWNGKTFGAISPASLPSMPPPR